MPLDGVPCTNTQQAQSNSSCAQAQTPPSPQFEMNSRYGDDFDPLLVAGRPFTAPVIVSEKQYLHKELRRPSAHASPPNAIAERQDSIRLSVQMVCTNVPYGDGSLNISAFAFMSGRSMMLRSKLCGVTQQ
jgi:hypothetical protein